jgi:hypothetical protein
MYKEHLGGVCDLHIDGQRVSMYAGSSADRCHLWNVSTYNRRVLHDHFFTAKLRKHRLELRHTSN